MAAAIAEEKFQRRLVTKPPEPVTEMKSVPRAPDPTITDATKVPAPAATKRNESPATKVGDATKLTDATKVKMGRPLVGSKPMTSTERSRRYRERQKAVTP